MAGFNRDFDERDDAQVFDASEDQESEGSSLLMAIVISLLVLAALGCVVWIAYNNGVAHGHRDIAMQAAIASAKPAAVAADSSDAAAKASGKAEAKAEDGEGSYAPPPAQQSVSGAASAPPPARVAQVAPTSQSVTVRSAPVKAIDNPNKPPAQVAPPRPLSAVANMSAHETGTTRLQPPPVPTKVAPTKTATKVEAAKAPDKVVAEKPAAKADPVAKPSASGSYLLQLGAYKSEDEANTAWKNYKGKHSAILAGAGPNIQKADLGDKGTWYRLRTGPFASKETAQSVCDKLKADGGACFPAK